MLSSVFLICVRNKLYMREWGYGLYDRNCKDNYKNLKLMVCVFQIGKYMPFCKGILKRSAIHSLLSIKTNLSKKQIN